MNRIKFDPRSVGRWNGNAYKDIWLDINIHRKKRLYLYSPWKRHKVQILPVCNTMFGWNYWNDHQINPEMQRQPLEFLHHLEAPHLETLCEYKIKCFNPIWLSNLVHPPFPFVTVWICSGILSIKWSHLRSPKSFQILTTTSFMTF